MDAHSKALEKIIGDMDDMEGKKMFSPAEESPKGVDISISIIPKVDDIAEEKAEGEDIESDDDEMGMPPFLRKKK